MFCSVVFPMPNLMKSEVYYTMLKSPVGKTLFFPFKMLTEHKQNTNKMKILLFYWFFSSHQDYYSMCVNYLLKLDQTT